MTQEEFGKMLLKYEAGLCSENERKRIELRHKNLRWPKEIINPLQLKFQIFNNINSGLKKEIIKRQWQWIATDIVCCFADSRKYSYPPPPPPYKFSTVN